MIWKRMLQGFLVLLLLLASAVSAIEFSSSFFGPTPRKYRKVTVVSVDHKDLLYDWLVSIQIRVPDGSVAKTLILTTDASGLQQGETILLMTGERDLKREYEQRVTIPRLLIAYHAYILLMAPLVLLLLVIRYTIRRIRA
jgi:hypothetical protein